MQPDRTGAGRPSPRREACPRRRAAGGTGRSLLGPSPTLGPGHWPPSPTLSPTEHKDVHSTAAPGAWPGHACITRAEGHLPPSPRPRAAHQAPDQGPPTKSPTEATRQAPQPGRLAPSPRLVPWDPGAPVSGTRSQSFRAWALEGCGQDSDCWLPQGGGPLLAPPQLQAGLASAELPAGPPGPCCLKPVPALVTPGLLCPHSSWEPPNTCAGGCGRSGGAGADPGRRAHLPQGPEPDPKEVGELCSGLIGRQHVQGQSPARSVAGRGDPVVGAPPWAPAFCRRSRLGCGDRLVTRKLREGRTGPLPGGDTSL